MTYYYPDNMAQQTLFAEYWSGKDLILIILLFILGVLSLVVLKSFLFFIPLLIYVIFSAKIANGYSLTRLMLLYTRFLLTDTLIYKWY